MSPITPAVQAVIDLFADSLRDVRFADVDAATLGDLAAAVDAAAEVVLAAESELARQSLALKDRQDALLQHAHRALAYARVYAESDVALTERLDQIALPRATRRPRIDGEALVLEPGPTSHARKVAATGQPARRGRRPSEAVRGDGALDVPLPGTGEAMAGAERRVG